MAPHTTLVDDLRSYADELLESPSVDDRNVGDRLRGMVERYELGDLHANQGPAHHRPDKATAVTAAELALPRAGTLRDKVIIAISQSGYGLRVGWRPDGVTEPGLTQEEVAHYWAVYLYSIAPRFAELERMGWIKDSGRTRTTTRGQQAVVWVLTDIAVERLHDGG